MSTPSVQALHAARQTNQQELTTEKRQRRNSTGSVVSAAGGSVSSDDSLVAEIPASKRISDFRISKTVDALVDRRTPSTPRPRSASLDLQNIAKVTPTFHIEAMIKGLAFNQ